MAVQDPYLQYKENQVNTAPPEELTMMLYRGAVRFINQAIKAIDNNKLDEANNNIIKAQNIYSELTATLDYQYPVSQNLASLYDYVSNLLIQANLKKDKALLEEALTMAKEFVTTWEEAIKIYRQSKPAGEWIK